LAKKQQTNICQSESFQHGSLEAHNRLLNQILIALSKQGLCRVWRSETGKAIKLSGYFRAKSTGDFESLDRSIFAYGLKGSADITGILKNGKRIEIEIKTGDASQSKEQKNFAAMIKNFGGHYFVCRSVDDALNSVKHCLS
jgi:hypothetical protein